MARRKMRIPREVLREAEKCGEGLPCVRSWDQQVCLACGEQCGVGQAGGLGLDGGC